MTRLEKQRAWQKFKVPTARGRKQRTGYSNIGEHSGRQGFAHGYAEQMEKGDTPMTSQEQQRLDHAAVQLEKIFGRKKKWQSEQGAYASGGSDRPSRFSRGLSALGRGARAAGSGTARAARATGGALQEFGRGAAQESRAMYRGGQSVMEPAPGAKKELVDRKLTAQNRKTERLQREFKAKYPEQQARAQSTPTPLGPGNVRQVASGGPKTTNPAYNRPPPQSGGNRRNRFGVRKMEKAMISLQKFLDNDCGCEGDSLMQYRTKDQQTEGLDAQVDARTNWAGALRTRPARPGEKHMSQRTKGLRSPATDSGTTGQSKRSDPDRPSSIPAKHATPKAVDTHEKREAMRRERMNRMMSSEKDVSNPRRRMRSPKSILSDREFERQWEQHLRDNPDHPDNFN